MKKVWIALLLTPFASFAQKNRLAISAGVVVPYGILKSSASTGWENGFYFQHDFNRYFSGVAEVGTALFGEKTTTLTSPPISISTDIHTIPLQVGAKFHLTNDYDAYRSLYVLGELGAVVLTGKVKVNGSDQSPPNETDFGYLYGIGYEIRRFDLSYRQQFIVASGSTITYFSFRVSVVCFQK